MFLIPASLPHSVPLPHPATGISELAGFLQAPVPALHQTSLHFTCFHRRPGTWGSTEDRMLIAREVTLCAGRTKPHFPCLHPNPGNR